MMFQGKTYWLVGASEGLGKALAFALDQQGADLVISARSETKLKELAENLSHQARILPLDVTDNVSIEKAMDAVGHVDGIIFLAAQYEPMTSQIWDVTASQKIADVNFLGGIRVLGRIVPVFSKRDSGHVVVIGSLSGYRGLPGALAYGASKAGLMHLAETIRADLWKTNVKVQLFNLGFIKTRLTQKNTFRMPFIMTPEKAAESIVNGMSKNRFKFDNPWIFSLVFRLSRLLPQFLYERLFAR